LKNLRDKVVVVTGGSGGLGRELAVQFASQGSIVLVGARREPALEETVRLCRAVGGTAFHVVTDVTDEQAVQRLAEAALCHRGRIDVWVNNAGVTLFSPLEAAPFEQHRRVIETNLYGSIFGARAVLPVFRRQREGVLINVGSILSKIGQPFVPSYVISKFALRGLSEALRAEVANEPDIHVCTMLAYAMNTQHFEMGANQEGRQFNAMPPAQSPEKVARLTVKLALHPRREVHVPGIAALGLALHALMPRTVERLLSDALVTWHLSPTPQLAGDGNLSHPTDPDGAVHGTRAPRISTAAFAVWIFARFLRIELEAVSALLGIADRRRPGLPPAAPAPMLADREPAAGSAS